MSSLKAKIVIVVLIVLCTLGGICVNKSLGVMNTKSDLKKQESIMTPSELQTDALKNE
jgi:hypothetical protein